MRRFLTLLLMALVGSSLMAQDLYISGNVVDENGTAVAGQEVYLSSSDSVGGFYYNTVLYTGSNGIFSDSIPLGDVSQGEIIASVQSCNEMISVSQFFNPGNYDLEFLFQICTDTTGGGNDTIVEGCDNYFYYYQDDLDVSFFGGIEQEGDVTFTWSFGDGTAGDGMEVSHTYASEGSYEVSLETVLNDTCNFISYQTIYVFEDSTGGGNDSTYCYNDYTSMIDEYSVAFEGWVGDGQVAALFWDFGDGVTAEGLNTTHIYSEAGEYVVTFTTEYLDGDSTCVASTSQTIIIQGGSNNEFLYGTVKKEESLLDFGTVQLFSILSDTVGGDDDIVLFEETIIDSAGMYFFANVPSGNYLILAQATQQSAYFDQTVPTYYGDVIHWTDASIVSLGDPMNPYDINLILTGENASGNGAINGDVIGDGFKSQLIEDEIIILLLDENNNALSFTLSELDSDFDFSNLEYGNYIVYAEVVGISTNPGMVTLSADNPTAVIDVLITPNGISTGIDDINNIQITGSIYPNPVGSTARLDLNLLQSSQLELNILNQMGQVLLSRSEFMNQGINKIELDTQSYPSGVYFIQIRGEKSIVNQKFIKK